MSARTLHLQTELKILLYIGDLPDEDEEDFDFMAQVAGSITVDAYLRDLAELAQAIATAVEPFEIQPALPDEATS